MSGLSALREQLGRAVDELATPAIVADENLYAEKEAEIAVLQGNIERLEKAQSRAAALARPVSGNDDDGSHTNDNLSCQEFLPTGSIDGLAPRSVRAHWSDADYLSAARKLTGFVPDKQRHFRSFGEQLQAVFNYATSGGINCDPRLSRGVARSDRFSRAPTGAGEVDPSAGGFLVQTDFATSVFLRAYDMGQVLSRVQKLSLSTVANSIKIPAVDETSRVTGSRWGGVQSYWVGEGTAPTATKPKFRLIELDLKKLMSLWYVTEELMQDASVLTSIANQAFSEEIMFMTEDAIFRGTGSGQPQGFLNAQALVTVAKETGQASKSIVYDNVLKMWSRCWGRSRPNAVWFINQDVEPQLYSLSQVIGTAGVPVYLPANGISGQPYGTLFGRSVIPVEYCDTVGNLGDIVLCDFSQYVLADKGGVQAASSMHVAFTTDEWVFRIIYRVDGEVIWHNVLTPYKGSNTLSPFVALAAR